MRHGLTGVIVETDPELLADGCDALILITDWTQFQTLDYAKMAKKMHSAFMIDGEFLRPKTIRSRWFPICRDWTLIPRLM